jgi:branched-chain amino acid transport system substrate-binding protein
MVAGFGAIAALGIMVAGYGGAGASTAKTTAKATAHAASVPCITSGSGKATGSPIRLGAIVTNQPGTSFTDITNTAQAYFTCVNDHGGVNGHPIKYYIEQEQTNPAQVAADAKKLVQSDKVMGIVGNTSIIDCAINGNYYKAHGYYIIDSGIASQCYSSSYSATVNMGPRYSSDGAAQYVIAHGAKKVVFDQSNVPGTGYNVGGVIDIAKAAHIPEVSLTEDVPISDANSVALKEVQDAGAGGAVVLNFTPPEALIILQAAQKLGLENQVQWACSTPCNTNFLSSALGPAWNGKLHVNAELNLTNESGPDGVAYRALLKQYAPSIALGSFSEMGFVEAKIAVTALMGVKGAYTTSSVNTAFVNVKDFKTDLLCKPWYYQKLPVHLPNNTDRTVTPDNGVMVQQQGCFAISPVDPEVKYIRGIEASRGL